MVCYRYIKHVVYYSIMLRYAVVDYMRWSYIIIIVHCDVLRMLCDTCMICGILYMVNGM